MYASASISFSFQSDWIFTCEFASKSFILATNSSVRLLSLKSFPVTLSTLVLSKVSIVLFKLIVNS